MSFFQMTATSTRQFFETYAERTTRLLRILGWSDAGRVQTVHLRVGQRPGQTALQVAFLMQSAAKCRLRRHTPRRGLFSNFTSAVKALQTQFTGPATHSVRQLPLAGLTTTETRNEPPGNYRLFKSWY